MRKMLSLLLDVKYPFKAIGFGSPLLFSLSYEELASQGRSCHPSLKTFHGLGEIPTKMILRFLHMLAP